MKFIDLLMVPLLFQTRNKELSNRIKHERTWSSIIMQNNIAQHENKMDHLRELEKPFLKV